MPKLITPKAPGFTLIELLIVITIIGIVSAIGLVMIGNYTKNARDAKRKSDAAQLQKLLQSYKIANGAFPNTGWIDSTLGQNWIPGLVADGNIKALPTDPTNTIVSSSGYFPPWDTDSSKNFAYYYIR